MVATSENAYKNNNHMTVSLRKKYTNNEIKQIISEGQLSSQIKLSNDFFSMSGIYRRIIIFYATFLKYSGILVPTAKNNAKIESKEVKNKYFDAVHFIDKINLPVLCTNFSTKALLNGAYYGIIQSVDDETLSVLDLPVNFCSTRYKDVKNNDVIEFDLGYFDTVIDDNMKKVVFSVYPKEMIKAYLAYKKKSSVETRYYRIPTSIGICFPLFDARPMFLSAIGANADYEDYRAVDKQREQDEVKKIIIQQIPHLNDGTLLFEPEEAEEIHAGTVGMMKNNKNVSVLTTYADIDVSQSETSSQSVRDTIARASNAIYTEAGVSSQLFDSTGNMALNSSLENDLAFVMYLANKFSIFITNLVNNLYSTDKVDFKYRILPISYYNEKEYLENAQKQATSGYSLIIPALSMGISQSELLSIKDLENKVLKLTDKLIPLSTSYTQSGKAGGQTKQDDQKSDKTVANIEANGVNNNG